MPGASVIVVCHHPGPWLDPCLASVAQHHLVVIDNGSPGAVASEIANRHGAEVVRAPTNLGFPAAVNAGLARARSDLVALLNDDALACNDWIERSGAVLADPAVAAVGPKLVLEPRYATIELPDPPHPTPPGDGRRLGRQLRRVQAGGTEVLEQLVGGIYRLEQDERGPFRWTNGLDPVHVPLPPGAGDAEVVVDGDVVARVRTGDVINNAGSYLSSSAHGGDYGFETADDGRFDAPAERFGVMGAALVARRATFDRLGGLAGSFFAYYEDLDWSWRARLAGMSLRYEPAAVVRHARSATTARSDASVIRLLHRRNRLLCIARNAPARWAAQTIASELRAPDPPSLRPSLARHLPTNLAARARHGRVWVRSPAEVFAEWAGRDETWGLPSQTRR